MSKTPSTSRDTPSAGQANDDPDASPDNGAPAAMTPPRASRVDVPPSRHPLGPLVYRRRALRPVRVRIRAGLVALVLAAVLSTAVYLHPDPAGVGTHRQLGFPPCNMLMLTGHPCPSCGMTTAFSYTVRGRWVSAFHAQPAGLLLAIVMGIALVLALHTTVTGTVWHLNWYRATPFRVAVVFVAIVLAAWAYKLTTT